MTALLLGTLLTAGFLIRVPYVVYWDIFFSSDTAILGLMAKHFLRGEFAPYYWGEGYYGSLDPLLLMPLFRIWGATPCVMHCLPLFFSLTLITGYFFYLRAITDEKTAAVSTLILALAPPAFQSITFSTYNYILVMNLGLAHFLLAKRISHGARNRGLLFAFGLVAGFSWYYFRLIALFWAAIALHFFIARTGPEQWTDIKNRLRQFSREKIWREFVLLQNAPVPVPLRYLLAAVNLYNCANLAVALVLWLYGDWIFTVHSKTIKLYFWPIFKSSLLMGGAVFVIAGHKFIRQQIFALWGMPPVKHAAQGFLIGYLPAIIGYFIGRPPASPGGFVSLPVFLQNFRMTVTEMIPRMAGETDVKSLGITGTLAVSAGFAVLFWKWFRAVRERILQDKPLPAEFTLLSLAVCTIALGTFCNQLADVSSLRYMVPLYFCLPLGIV